MRESATNRPAGLDVLVRLSFAALYAWVANLIVHRIALWIAAAALHWLVALVPKRAKPALA